MQSLNLEVIFAVLSGCVGALSCASVSEPEGFRSSSFGASPDIPEATSVELGSLPPTTRFSVVHAESGAASELVGADGAYAVSEGFGAEPQQITVTAGGKSETESMSLQITWVGAQPVERFLSRFQVSHEQGAETQTWVYVDQVEVVSGEVTLLGAEHGTLNGRLKAVTEDGEQVTAEFSTSLNISCDVGPETASAANLAAGQGVPLGSGSIAPAMVAAPAELQRAADDRFVTPFCQAARAELGM